MGTDWREIQETDTIVYLWLLLLLTPALLSSTCSLFSDPCWRESPKNPNLLSDTSNQLHGKI